MSSEVPEAPEVTCLCAGQGAIQAKIRPGIWIPLIRSLHCYQETWKVSANPVVCSKDVLMAVSKLHKRSLQGNIFTVDSVEEKAEKSSVGIIVYSKCRTVYVIQLTFTNEESAGSIAIVRAFSTGIFPAWFPLNFLFSSLLCFVPFYDSGQNKLWINWLKNQMTIPIEIIKKGRKC